MKAFLDDIKVKEKYTSRVLAHFEADEIIKGRYWENGRGCAVGCTIHSSDHWAYETELGIPIWLAQVEDKIFEGLPDERAKHWPSEFLNVIHVGADLEKIKAPFMVFILKSTLDKFDHNKHPSVLKSVNDVIALYERGNATPEEWRRTRIDAAAAAYAAAAYANAANANAANAANAVAAYANAANANAVAAAAYANVAAADAVAAAAYAATAAAANAANAAAATAANAAAATAANAADATVRWRIYAKFADELLRLMVECMP